MSNFNSRKEKNIFQDVICKFNLVRIIPKGGVKYFESYIRVVLKNNYENAKPISVEEIIIKKLNNMKISLINLKEIDNLFIVNISNGHFVSTGSFIAYDFEGNEYFAHSSIVEKHNNKFFALKENCSSFYVLIEKEIWGEKWDNSEKSCIKFISDTKLECENYKDNLFYQKIIKYNLINMEQSRLDSIDIHTYNKESPYSNEIDILRKLLTDLNERID